VFESMFGGGDPNSYSNKKKGEITMPTLPKLVKDAKSLDVFDHGHKRWRHDEVDMNVQRVKSRNYYFIKEIYLSLFARGPSLTEMKLWMSRFSQKASKEGVYRGLVNGEKYAKMEKKKKKLAPKVTQFSVNYLQKFIGKKVKKSTFYAYNIFSLKRVLTSETLDLMALFKNKKDFLHWYALLSSELSPFLNYQKEPIRKEESSDKHFEWAKKQRYETIKAEIIIKLHIALTNMNQ